MFHWTRRMPYWRNLSFFANQIFLRTTINRHKVVSSSKESFTKKFLWSRGFCFWHPCWKLLPQIRNFFIQKQKRMSNTFFWKKTLLSQSFSLLNIWNAVLTTPLKTFRQQNTIFSLIAHKSKSFGDCQIFPRNVRHRRTRRMPTWFVHFFLKFLWTRMLWTWHHWRIFFLRFWKNFANSREKY